MTLPIWVMREASQKAAKRIQNIQSAQSVSFMARRRSPADLKVEMAMNLAKQEKRMAAKKVMNAENRNPMRIGIMTT